MALSDDLRKRVVEAVVEGGLSRNVAAKRFEVSIAERGALGAALRDPRRGTAGAFGRRSPLRPHLGASRLSAGSHSPHAGHHAAGNKGAPFRQLRRTFLFVRYRASSTVTRSRLKKRPRAPRSSGAADPPKTACMSRPCEVVVSAHVSAGQRPCRRSAPACSKGRASIAQSDQGTISFPKIPSRILNSMFALDSARRMRTKYEHKLRAQPWQTEKIRTDSKTQGR